MSSHTIEQKFIFFPKYEPENEEIINFKECVILFSEFPSSLSCEFIYNGNESIKFNKRHPVYRKLFLNEFCTE